MSALSEDPHIPPPRTRLQRGSLTQEIIVTESLRLLDTDGLDGFSLPKLGRALGADQTAVYRHFASKDDLVLAIADWLIHDAMTGLEPRACWIDTLSEMVRRLRATYLAHPAAASMVSYRTTAGPAEIRTVEIIIDAVMQAGFEAAEAAVMYRTVADFALACAGAEASFLSMDKRAQQMDRLVWAQAYVSVDRRQHPSIWQVRTELTEVDDEEIFEGILKTFMTGLHQLAPRPCTCHPPAQRAVSDEHRS
jgi:TetR/AcrR family transcriptional regulator, tetracycline repressor protein